MKNRWRVEFFFAWYDFWLNTEGVARASRSDALGIGVFYDRVNKTVYICPLPMCVIKIWKE